MAPWILPAVMAGGGALSGWLNQNAMEEQRKRDLLANAVETKYSPWLETNYRKPTAVGSRLGQTLGGALSGGMMGAQLGGMVGGGGGGGQTMPTPWMPYSPAQKKLAAIWGESLPAAYMP